MEEDLEKIIDLLTKSSREEKDLVRKAYQFAEKAHEGQKRNSGEPYLVHPFETARSIAELGLDAVSVAAAFLHDILEDTDIGIEVLEKEFGKEVAFIVEGVTKLGTIKYRGADRHNESLRKLLFATSKDLRVLIVKLCDRLHNIKTLSFVPKEKQDRIAKETLEIYAPIAYRLGIRKLSHELEDLSFPYVDKEGYNEMASVFQRSHDEKIESLEKFRKSVMKELVKAGFANFRSDYRVKNLYSLYKKYLKYKKDVGKIADILAMRLVVEKTEDCYKALGIIHGAWKPVPGRMKDYIAFPKLNGYQSLHTTVFTGDGSIVEIQIRTEEMHKEAEYGIAAHALYKAGEKNEKQVAPWIQAMLPHSINEIKKDFLSERIFVFTPLGDVVDLPAGSSAIDFAYAIHSDIGNQMSGAKIDGKLCSIGNVLKGNEIVEIIISKNARPKRKWLEWVKTSLARKQIRNFIKG
ncbi:MAG: RelA/SpoT family protein [Candidatus Zambryskibacteria bacterium]